ncbi:response regulator transcription factor [Paraburkholderia sp. MMS20-SJTR3]|uniref:Response regulator transcription factor n=1 Tax=Paraburkholderia sejongensis TaxID=2886946 RepID=A0ABS8K6S4_9BURK|nr:response regulator transcription factor [Paraburkholderia sp. MMS20-SJTR3]MCC8397573.1 response regulator transcription factor [Paraburkholderia sp. MMS20-SJTR3]
MKINLILADDHPALIAGVKYELSRIHTLNVAATAHDSTALVDVLSRVSCDILITDFAMPGGDYGDGMAMLSFLRRRHPDLKIIVFMTIDNFAIADKMRRIGIQSVLNKAKDVGYLITAIHAVHAGANYYSPTLQESPSSGDPADTSSKRIPGLSSRELEVIRLLLSGLTVSKIATQLSRTKQTVSAQKRSAMRKLGIESDSDLYRFAFETGLPADGAL